MTIVKRKKTSAYAQIDNHALQEGLQDLSAIGLLSYIMSLPSNWELHKTYLHKKFTRRTVDAAWKKLVEKKYVIGIVGWYEKKKTYMYQVSDVPFTEEEFKLFEEQTIHNLQLNGSEFHKPMAIDGSPFQTNFQLHVAPKEESEVPQTAKSTEKPSPSCTVQNEQYTLNSTNRASTKEITTNEVQTKKEKDLLSNILTIVNYQTPANNKVHSVPKKQKNENPIISAEEVKEQIEQKIKAKQIITDPNEALKLFTNAANEYYSEFAIGRWNKKQWLNLISQFVSETLTNERYLNVPYGKIKGYVYSSIRNMVDHHDYKHGRAFANYNMTMSGASLYPELASYNWLEAE